MNKDEQVANRYTTYFSLSIFFLLFLLFYLSLTKYFNHPQGKIQVDTVSHYVHLEIARDGHYRAMGEINGHPVLFLLDTGATNIAIPDKLAKKLDLPYLNRSYAQSTNGIVASFTTQLDEVNLGGLRVQGLSASILSNMQEDEVLLGMNFLRHFEWTQSNGRLSLHRGKY